MEPLTIDSFKPYKIRAINSEQKIAGNLNYTSVKFEYDGDKVPLLRINGTCKLFRFKGPIYSLSINCDEDLEEFFENLCGVVAKSNFSKT